MVNQFLKLPKITEKGSLVVLLYIALHHNKHVFVVITYLTWRHEHAFNNFLVKARKQFICFFILCIGAVGYYLKNWSYLAYLNIYKSVE